MIRILRNLIKPKKAVVLDTNLFVAAYWNKHSASASILRSASEGEVKFLYTKQIKKEVFFILKNINVGKHYSDYIESIFSNGRQIKPRKHVSVIKEDPQDDKYLDCAISGKAKYIVTNDKHLLKIGHYRSIRIVRPGEFIKH